MRELIRRAASHPSAPFSASSSPIASPLAKTTKSALRRIAPLHATRRTPPPPPPRPPPPKKSKKMLQLEEKWEMELEDEVEGWWALTDEEPSCRLRTSVNLTLVAVLRTKEQTIGCSDGRHSHSSVLYHGMDTLDASHKSILLFDDGCP